MPGALSRATPSQRERFEQQCRDFCRETQSSPPRTVTPAVARVDAVDLLQMFPALDPELVQSLAVQAVSMQQVVEWLLELSAGEAEDTPQRSSEEAPNTADDAKFPVLVDSDGWQVVSLRESSIVDRGDTAGDGEQLSWSDRARIAAALPGPETKSVGPAASSLLCAGGTCPPLGGSSEKVVNEAVPLTEYEVRRMAGRARVLRRAKFGRQPNPVEAAPEPESASDSEEEVVGSGHRRQREVQPRYEDA